MALAAREAGYHVAVATRVREGRGAIEAHGFQLYDVLGPRGAFGPAAALRDAIGLHRAVLAFRPDILHLVALRAIALGSLVGCFARTPGLVLAPTRLGTLWVIETPAARLGRAAVRAAVRLLIRSNRCQLIFENRDDPAALGLHAAFRSRVTIVGGAGIDPGEFVPLPSPAEQPIRIAVVARMLRIKGIAEAVAAVTRARAAGCDVALDLWGAPDPDNLRSVTAAELEAWAGRPGIIWHGATRDVRGALAACDIVMLLSRGGDGLPRALVEAAACGRPIIATDAPGCRTAVADSINGILVPVGDIDAAAQAIMTLARDARARARMGAAGRARFEERFTVAKVTGAVLEVYRRLWGRQAAFAALESA
jgi:glycosyltransferase involved in cell wall biosynthesis